MATYSTYDDISSPSLGGDLFRIVNRRRCSQPLSFGMDVDGCMTFWGEIKGTRRYLNQTLIIPIDVEHKQKDWARCKGDALSDKNSVHDRKWRNLIFLVPQEP